MEKGNFKLPKILQKKGSQSKNCTFLCQFIIKTVTL